MVATTDGKTTIETTLTLCHDRGFKIDPQDFHQLMQLKTTKCDDPAYYRRRVLITIEELPDDEPAA